MKTARGPQPSTSNSVGTARACERRQIVERQLLGARDVPGGGDGRRHQHGRAPVALADQEMAGAVAADELDLRRVGRRQGLVEGSALPRRDHALAFSAFSSLGPQLLGPQIQVDQAGRGDPDRGVGADDDAPQHGDREAVEHRPAEQHQRQHRHEHRARGHQGARQRLVDAEVQQVDQAASSCSAACSRARGRRSPPCR